MGKVMGGTNRFNNMIYTVGHPSDYYEWYKDLKEFNYENDVLYYHKKAFGSYYDSPIYASNTIHTTVADHILNATKSLGYKERDLNIHPHTGNISEVN